MNPKLTPKQRASKFYEISSVKKFLLISENFLPTDTIFKVEKFMGKFMEVYDKPPSGTQITTLCNLLMTGYSENELFTKFNELHSLKPGSLERFTVLFGEESGKRKFHGKVDKMKSTINEDYARNRFLNKKDVKNRLKKNLSDETLNELDIIFNTIPESKSVYVTEILVDILNSQEHSSEPLLNRLNTVLNSHHYSLDYCTARFGIDNGHSIKNAKNRVLSDCAYKNFPNTLEYWISKGYDIEFAKTQQKIFQKRSGQFAADVIRGKPSPRSLDFWIKKGFSMDDSRDIIKKIQSRDHEYFVRRYGNIEGTYRYEKMMGERLNTWMAHSEEEREAINKSKGRTFMELVDSHGYEKAVAIRKSFHSANVSISRESRDFFMMLDLTLPDDIAKKTVHGAKSREWIISHENGIYFVDFKMKNKIIEYHGSYWHGDNRLFEVTDIHPSLKISIEQIHQNDKERIQIIESLGFKVLTVWSHDVSIDPIAEINKCKEFLIYDHENI